MGKITIRDVAREAGVSISPVSLVMNAKRDAEGNLDCNVNKDTARRIAEVAKRGTALTRLRRVCAADASIRSAW